MKLFNFTNIQFTYTKNYKLHFHNYEFRLYNMTNAGYYAKPASYIFENKRFLEMFRKNYKIDLISHLLKLNRYLKGIE